MDAMPIDSWLYYFMHVIGLTYNALPLASLISSSSTIRH